MNQNKRHFYLYVLILEQGKHYVGITAQTPQKRFQEHVNHIRAANWTKKYKPLSILDTKDLGMKTLEEAEAYENKVVRKYMKEKGYNNARGGDLTDERDYISRFGWYIDIDDYATLTTVLFLMLCIIVLGAAYYLK